MPLESPVNWIDDLVTTNPPGTDPRRQGDDHIRNIKTALKANFPRAGTAFYLPDSPSVIAGNHTVVAADNNRLLRLNATAASRTVDLPAAGANRWTGYVTTVMKNDDSANTVTLDGNATDTINGSLTYVLTEQHEFVTVMFDGTEWRIIGAASKTAADSLALFSHAF